MVGSTNGGKCAGTTMRIVVVGLTSTQLHTLVGSHSGLPAVESTYLACLRSSGRLGCDPCLGLTTTAVFSRLFFASFVAFSSLLSDAGVFMFRCRHPGGWWRWNIIIVYENLIFHIQVEMNIRIKRLKFYQYSRKTSLRSWPTLEKQNKFGDGICCSLYLIINVILTLFKYLIMFYTQISTIDPPKGGYNE